MSEKSTTTISPFINTIKSKGTTTIGKRNIDKIGFSDKNAAENFFKVDTIPDFLIKSNTSTKPHGAITTSIYLAREI